MDVNGNASVMCGRHVGAGARSRADVIRQGRSAAKMYRITKPAARNTIASTTYRQPSISSSVARLALLGRRGGGASVRRADEGCGQSAAQTVISRS